MTRGARNLGAAGPAGAGGQWSIARRLMLVVAGAVLVLWLAAVAISAGIIADEINEVYDSALQETAQRLLPLAEAGLANGDNGRSIGRHSESAEEYLLYQVRDASGRVLLHSHDAPGDPYDMPLATGFFHAGDLYGYSEGNADRSLFIQVVELEGHRPEAIIDSAMGLLFPLILLLPLAGLAIYVIVRRAMLPLHRLRREIGARGGGNLAALAVAGLPAELAPIVTDINRLLQRLDRTLAAERDFAANSAHELRTPVAAAIAQSQRLAAELAGSPHQARVEQVIAALRRLGALAERLLQLARAESGVAASETVADLLPVIDLVCAEFERQPAKAGRIRWREVPRRFAAAIDIDAFAILLRNLIENAFYHGAAGTPVELFVDARGALHVVNAGPVVPAAELRRLTERFARGRAGGAGFGLGLAIVAMILEQVGGRLDLQSPAAGRDDGFEAVVVLPAA